MKIDKFTKLVLTVIAINLTILTVKDLGIIQEVYANEPTNGVETVKNYGLVPLNEDGSITVKLSNTDRIDVNIVDINTSDELNVNLKDISTYDKLDVNLKDISTSDKLNVHLKSSDSYSLKNAEPILIKKSTDE